MDIDKISFKSTDAVIYRIKYITKESLHNENIDSANRLYVTFNNVGGYIECSSIDESNGDKYLIFTSTNKNIKVLEKYTELWNEIKNQIETINGSKPIRYGKYFIKIRFESDNDLHLGKILSVPICIIAVGSVFQKDNNSYLQAHLHECLYECGYYFFFHCINDDFRKNQSKSFLFF